MVKKCIVWGTGKCFIDNVNMLKYHELCGHFEVIGITSGDFGYYQWDKYNYITKEELIKSEYDFVIVMAYEPICKSIIKEAVEYGIPQESIFTYRILKHEKLEIERYINIRKTPISILSNNCWGGITYHSLDMEFYSPLVNMHVKDEDYIKFLRNPQFYMEQQLEFKEMKVIDAERRYPIAKCGDILLWFNHYKEYDDAERKWEERKRRIKWDNLFVEMFTENPRVAEEFVNLPYKKKICFVPFDTKEQSLVYIPYLNSKNFSNKPMWEIVTGMARGKYPYYDVLDLIEKGKLTVNREFV